MESVQVTYDFLGLCDLWAASTFLWFAFDAYVPTEVDGYLCSVVIQRYGLSFILEGKVRLYIQHGAKLIVNQLSCLYRHFGANSDGVACFLICTSLISQQNLYHIWPAGT
jgi:hypothetical protein